MRYRHRMPLGAETSPAGAAGLRRRAALRPRRRLRGASTPFLFFCDFEPDLAPLVTEGRRGEFARFPAFSDPGTRDRIPDPSAEGTFHSSVLDWAWMEDPDHREWFELYREPLGGFERPPGDLLYSSGASEASGGSVEHGRELPAWSVAWYLRVKTG